MRYDPRILILSIFCLAFIFENAGSQPPHEWVELVRGEYYPNQPAVSQYGHLINVSYFAQANCMLPYPDEGHRSGVGFCARTQDDPPAYIVPLDEYVINHFEYASYSPDSIAWGGWVINEALFDVAGTIEVRFGAYVNLPLQYTYEQLWENIESVGIYESDQLYFPHWIPNMQATLIQPCPWNWLPVTGEYLDPSGQPDTNAYNVTLRSVCSAIDPSQPQSYRMRWVLNYISWYDGECMNYPNVPVEFPEGPEPAPTAHNGDLKILHTFNPHLECAWDTTLDGFVGVYPEPISPGETLSVVVSCYDWGAHGKIHLEALNEPGTYWYNMTRFQRADSVWTTYSTIPRDEDNPVGAEDRLADFWEEQVLQDPLCPDTIISPVQIAVVQDDDGCITSPFPIWSYYGDYLNVFEEYRGFYCKGIHTRTSPWRKDVFIYVQMDTFAIGLGFAPSLGPFFHLIDSTEMRDYAHPDRHIISNNRKSVNWQAARIDSHLNCAATIFVEDISLQPIEDPLNLKIACTYFDSLILVNRIKIPPFVKFAKVFTRKIRYNSRPDSDTCIVNMPTDSLIQLQINAHEIGHMVNMVENYADTASIMYSLRPNQWDHPNRTFSPDDTIYFVVKKPGVQ
jgi:hypothetical protein